MGTSSARRPRGPGGLSGEDATFRRSVRMALRASTLCLALRSHGLVDPCGVCCRRQGGVIPYAATRRMASTECGGGGESGTPRKTRDAGVSRPGSTSCASRIEQRLLQARSTAGPSPHPNITTLSPSMFSDFRRCPALFKHRYIERQREEMDLPMIRGVLTHQALARLFDLPRHQRTLKNLSGLFQDAWRTSRLDRRFAHLFKGDDVEREWARDAMSLLARYMLLESPSEFDPVWREHKIVLSYGPDEVPAGVGPSNYGLNITGVMDRLDRREDGKLVVLDYKTGKAPTLKYSARANRRIVNEKFDQLRIYALLISKEIQEQPSEMEIMYLGGPSRIVMQFTEDQLLDTEKRVWQTWNAICEAVGKDDFPAVPQSICPWCSMRNVCSAFQGKDMDVPLEEGSETEFAEVSSHVRGDTELGEYENDKLS